MELVQKIQRAKYQFLTKILSHLVHEINNPLTMIYNRSNAMVDRLEKGDLAKDHIIGELKKIESSVERISKLLQSTRSFFKYAPIENSIEFSAVEVVENIESYFKASLEKKGIVLNVTCEIKKDSELVCCKGDPQNLTMALYEIVCNAKEAVQKQGNGQITITLKPVKNSFEIQVHDSAEPFNHEVSGNFLKPYTTTKPDHLGIGLSFCQYLLNDLECELALAEDKKTVKIVFKN